MKLRTAGAAALVALSAAVAPSHQDAFAIDHLLAVRYPFDPCWSPAGDRVAFLWDNGGTVGLWTVTVAGGAPVAVPDPTPTPPADPEAVDPPGAEDAAAAVAEPTSTTSGRPDRGVTSYSWSADGALLAYAQAGDLYVHEVAGGETRRITETAAIEAGPTFAPEGVRLAFARGGDLWLRDLGSSGREWELLALPEDLHPLSWSPDGSALLVASGGEIPERLGAWPLAGPVPGLDRGEVDLAVVDTATGAVAWLEETDEAPSEARWSDDGILAWQQVSHDGRRRRILMAAPGDWSPRTLVDETDDAWWSIEGIGAGPRWEPGGRRLVFISDRDGFAHLWLVDTASGAEPRPLQLSEGEFEVESPAWHPAGGRLVVAANRGSRSERALQLLTVPANVDGPVELEPISRLRGTSTAPRWGPDGESIAFLHADPIRPLDLWLQPPRDAAATQLTDSWPEDLSKDELVVPLPVRFPAADGRLVPAQLFVPEDPGEQLPAVVWAHGGGIGQNRFGWHPQRLHAIVYGFHQYLVQQGYAVLAVDYRGTYGYGRAYRVAAHRDLGGSDLDDLLAARRYLSNLNDPSIGRVGLWGLSYGGYLTLQALVTAPPAFDAAVEIAGPADLQRWARAPTGWWVRARLGDPEDNADLYRQRSPLRSVARIRTPLLIVHGADDQTAPSTGTPDLRSALQRADRDFEARVYPDEGHSFRYRETWSDILGEVASFFERHLAPAGALPPGRRSAADS